MQAEPIEVAAASSANSYVILAKLATGGMAELFLARTASTAGVERYVVLKRVLPSKLDDHDFVTMFLDEARLAAQLQHPNIAQVFDTGKLGESYFFSMEYVHGETVREVLHRAHELDQPVPLGCALTIAANAAAGLHHAHERIGLDGKPLGIVHRDVSPSNLMVSYEGNVKLVDFGVAKAATHRSVETLTGTVKGKIGYLSPEQCRGRASDRRGDLFSLGIMLWELLVGARLYKRANDYDTMEAIVLDPPVAPSTFRAEVPAELDAIVLKLLEKAPGDRYQTADELHDELESVADANGIRISNATLKRYLVDLFGKRPEPWVELQMRDAPPEIVTVSAAVSGLDTTVTVLDSQLSSVLDLTRTVHPSMESPATPMPAEVDPTEDAEPERRRWGIALACGAVLVIAGGFAWIRLQHDDAVSAPPPRLEPAVAVEAPTPPPKPPAQVVAQPTPTVVPAITEEPPKPKPAPRPHHVEDLAAELRAGKASEVVASCSTSPKLLAQNAATCTLAACLAHNTTTATAWIARVSGAKRASIVTQCANAGTTFEVAKKATCATDSTLCHHDATVAPPPPKGCDDQSDPMGCRK
ncbi:MAG TPA: serine/threonine-protein kinase [Kofleriaceae bacterium]